jgi:hypothetical protein
MNPRVPATFIVLAAAAAVAACGDQSVTEPRVAPSAPAATELEIACAYPESARLVQVSTSAQLASALASAQPGDFIHMADATYTGPFSTTVSGTARQRITLCGSRNAVIQTGSTSTLGFALRIRASYWTLTGFTVTYAQQGVSVEGGAYNDVQNLAVHGTGQEAIKLFKLSSYNTVRNNRIYDTGVCGRRSGARACTWAATTITGRRTAADSPTRAITTKCWTTSLAPTCGRSTSTSRKGPPAG